jgi:hypothetical protein
MQMSDLGIHDRGKQSHNTVNVRFAPKNGQTADVSVRSALCQ